MALSWRTLQAFPRLTSYDDAAKCEADTKPIRGRKPEVKPLGRRSQAYYSIKREENGDICVYCGHAILLRYRPDDTLHIYDPGYWNKATYNDMIREVTGICTETKDGKMWANVDGGCYLIRPSPRRKYLGDGKYADPTEPMPENIFKRVEKFAGDRGYHVWAYVNPPALTTHAIRRKEMRMVRERYANFIAYATVLDSIRERHPQPQEYGELFGIEFETYGNGVTPYYSWYHDRMPPPPHRGEFTHTHAAELTALMLSEDATDNYKAYLWLNVKRDWLHAKTTIADLIDRVLIMHHHKEVLTTREAVAGRVTKDRYAWAVPK